MAKKSTKKESKRPPKASAVPMPSPSRATSAPNYQSWRMAWIGATVGLTLLLVGALTWFFSPSSVAKKDEALAAVTATPAAVAEQIGAARSFPRGPANRCFGGPRFQKQLGFQSGQSVIGTSPGRHIGLFLADATGTGRIYQDPTWDDGGNLGAYVYDGQGNLYLVPAPFMNLHIDRLEDQTKLYRVDSDSAQMSLLLDLPAARPAHTSNPYGLMGLFYDCDTHSLYVTSVAGSTAREEAGRIFQVDLKTNQVVATYEGIDALSVGVFNGAEGKRLYFGSGRNTGVYSLALDEKGHFIGTPRLEFYLAALPGSHNDKASRITFNQAQQMVVKGMDFRFTLGVEHPTIYRDYLMQYNGQSDTWELVQIEPRTK